MPGTTGNRLNTNLIYKIFIIIFSLCIQSCTASNINKQDKDANRRRSPAENTASVASPRSDMVHKKEQIKKSDEAFDAYQNYQSLNAPISIEQIKKIKRAPVLNIQELNNIMDNTPNNVIHKPIVKPKAKIKHVVKKQHIDEDGNLAEIIKNNKQQAKNIVKPVAAVSPVVVAKPIVKPVVNTNKQGLNTIPGRSTVVKIIPSIETTQQNSVSNPNNSQQPNNQNKNTLTNDSPADSMQLPTINLTPTKQATDNSRSSTQAIPTVPSSSDSTQAIPTAPSSSSATQNLIIPPTPAQKTAIEADISEMKTLINNGKSALDNKATNPSSQNAIIQSGPIPAANNIANSLSKLNSSNKFANLNSINNHMLKLYYSLKMTILSWFTNRE